MVTILFVIYLASNGVIPISAGWSITGAVFIDGAIEASLHHVSVSSSLESREGL